MVMRILMPLVCCTLLLSCQLSKRTVRPDRKWAPALLQEDLKVMQSLLEAFHPSLYAYFPREEWMEASASFRYGIKDSLTTHQFLYGTVLPLISSIRCGHTQARYPKRLADQIRRHPPGFFPLQLKCWSDTMMVVGHLNPADSVVPRGSLLTAIDGLGTREIRDAMFRFMPADGYAQNFNNHRLSTSFPALHRNIFGLRPTNRIVIRTPAGIDTTLVLPAFRPDTSRPAGRRPTGNMTGKPLRFYHDTLTGAGVMIIHSFDKRMGVRRFYRKSFRDMRRRDTRELILDIRNNGGGYVDQEAQLARYLLREPFRVADTAAAVTRRMGAYRTYFRRSLDDRLVLNLLTRRQTDGKYHLRYWERRVFQPRRRNAFRGRTHVLISGPTFSAASLFAGQMKGRENIFLLGEETGGGAYANNGLLLPECRLPNTRIRLTLPLFRIVPNGKAPNSGRGVEPDILVAPDAESVRKGIDRKMEMVRRRILEHPAER